MLWCAAQLPFGMMFDGFSLCLGWWLAVLLSSLLSHVVDSFDQLLYRAHSRFSADLHVSDSGHRVTCPRESRQVVRLG